MTMELTINNAILKYNLLNCVKYADEGLSLSRELKIKIIKNKLNLDKIYKEFNQFQANAVEEVKTPRYNELASKPERTPEEEEEAKALLDELNIDLRNILTQKSSEVVDVNIEFFTEDEFNSFLEVNVNNSVVINGVPLPSEEYVIMVHNEFVK